MNQDKQIELSMEINDVLTYALQQNGLKIIREVCLKNNTENHLDNLKIQISSDTNLVLHYEQGIQALQAGEEIHLRDFNVLLNGDYLAALTERVVCTLKIELFQEGEILSTESRQVTILAYDEWPGLKYFPDLLAAFVTPNHPAIAELLQSASKWLDKWTGNPSLEGYQCKDFNRVKTMAAAAYAAIQEKNITYANPPSSFEKVGQRIRLCDAVLEQHLGTCMDMTLLYASVLEAIGLNPVLVLNSGHIFVGVWLVDESFADPMVEDPSQIEKRIAQGIHEMIVVECTAMCSGKTLNFDKAIQIAEKNVGDYNAFLFAVDVLRARKGGVRPIPVRIKTDAGYAVKQNDRKEQEVTVKPEEIGYAYSPEELQNSSKVSKLTQWERKLLDLSLRNMLINMRLTKAVVPLLVADLGNLEDALADGEEFRVTPRPLEWDLAKER